MIESSDCSKVVFLFLVIGLIIGLLLGYIKGRWFHND